METPVDIQESLATYHRGGEYSNVNGHVMLKHGTDLQRYATLIDETMPEVLVETGTRTGASALWFATRTPLQLVITVDITGQHRMPSLGKMSSGRAIPVVGPSTDPDTFAAVQRMVEGRRVMVSLDSDHTRAHVIDEIDLYGELVTPGCFMVVEDGLFDYASPEEWQKFSFGNPAQGNPLEAIQQRLVGNPAWKRREDIEGMYSVSHHPVGWWQKEVVNG